MINKRDNFKCGQRNGDKAADPTVISKTCACLALVELTRLFLDLRNAQRDGAVVIMILPIGSTVKIFSAVPPMRVNCLTQGGIWTDPITAENYVRFNVREDLGTYQFGLK